MLIYLACHQPSYLGFGWKKPRQKYLFRAIAWIWQFRVKFTMIITTSWVYICSYRLQRISCVKQDKLSPTQLSRHCLVERSRDRNTCFMQSPPAKSLIERTNVCKLLLRCVCLVLKMHSYYFHIWCFFLCVYWFSSQHWHNEIAIDYKLIPRLTAETFHSSQIDDPKKSRIALFVAK